MKIVLHVVVGLVLAYAGIVALWYWSLCAMYREKEKIEARTRREAEAMREHLEVDAAPADPTDPGPGDYDDDRR